MIELIAPSADRLIPKCAHFGVCGGCSLQHLPIPNQIELKQQTLLEQLKHFGQITPQTILPPLMANAWGYRRKARLGVRFVRKKEKVLVGFREKKHRYLADIQHCEVLHPSIGKYFNELSTLVQSLDQFEQIPQIEVAVGEDATALIFRHMTDLPESDKEKLIQFAQTYQFHVYLQPNSPAPITKLWPADGVERLNYYLPEHQIEMRFYPLDFTQINFEMNQLMLQQALTLLDPQPTDIVLDLFCGIGNFTLPIARKVKQVVGVEGSEIMVERANENAKHNNITNAEFYAANLQPASEELQGEWMKKTYNKILIDPPRTGAKELIAALPTLRVEKIVYISCNPATLARDAGALAQQGYQLTHAGVMNMFPHTDHIEAVAVFQKK